MPIELVVAPDAQDRIHVAWPPSSHCELAASPVMASVYPVTCQDTQVLLSVAGRAVVPVGNALVAWNDVGATSSALTTLRIPLASASTGVLESLIITAGLTVNTTLAWPISRAEQAHLAACSSNAGAVTCRVPGIGDVAGFIAPGGACVACTVTAPYEQGARATAEVTECPVDYYVSWTGECDKCPTGASCPDGVHVYPGDGQWNTGPASGFVTPCFPAARCIASGSTGNTACAVGTTGPACGSCAPGYYLADRVCRSCIADAPMIWLCRLLLMFYLIAALFLCSRKTSLRLRCALTAAAGARFLLADWTHTMGPVMHAGLHAMLAPVTLDSSSVALECLLPEPSNPFVRTVMAMGVLAPPFILVPVAGSMASNWVLERARLHWHLRYGRIFLAHQAVDRGILQRSLLPVTWAFLSYPTALRWTLTALACRRITPSTWAMQHNTSISCSSLPFLALAVPLALLTGGTALVLTPRWLYDALSQTDQNSEYVKWASKAKVERPMKQSGMLAPAMCSAVDLVYRDGVKAVGLWPGVIAAWLVQAVVSALAPHIASPWHALLALLVAATALLLWVDANALVAPFPASVALPSALAILLHAIGVSVSLAGTTSLLPSKVLDLGSGDTTILLLCMLVVSLGAIGWAVALQLRRWPWLRARINAWIRSRRKIRAPHDHRKWQRQQARERRDVVRRLAAGDVHFHDWSSGDAAPVGNRRRRPSILAAPSLNTSLRRSRVRRYAAPEPLTRRDSARGKKLRQMMNKLQKQQEEEPGGGSVPRPPTAQMARSRTSARRSSPLARETSTAPPTRPKRVWGRHKT